MHLVPNCIRIMDTGLYDRAFMAYRTIRSICYNRLDIDPRMDRGVDDAATPYWRTAADPWRVEIIQAPALSRGKSLALLMLLHCAYNIYCTMHTVVRAVS